MATRVVTRIHRIRVGMTFTHFPSLNRFISSDFPMCKQAQKCPNFHPLCKYGDQCSRQATCIFTHLIAGQEPLQELPQRRYAEAGEISNKSHCAKLSQTVPKNQLCFCELTKSLSDAFTTKDFKALPIYCRFGNNCANKKCPFIHAQGVSKVR